MLIRALYFRSAFPATLLGMLLTGCVTYEPRPLSPERSASAFEERCLADEGLRAFFAADDPDSGKIWPRKSWDLPALTMAALYYRPELELARAQWREAVAAIRSAGARPNPTLTVTPGYDFTPPEGSSPWFPQIGLDLPIETAGKRQIRVTRAEAQARAARLNVAVTAWQLRSDVRSALIDATQSNRRLDLLQREASIQHRIVQLLGERREAGAASTQELATAHIAADKTALELADVERQRTAALSRLAGVLGMPLAAVRNVTIDFALGEAPAVPPAEARRAALLQRADINAALADYAASESDLHREVASQYPDVHFGPGYQWDEGGNKWSLGIGIELPVFNRNRGPIAEAEARRAETAAKFRALQGRVITALDRAVADSTLADEQLRRADRTQQALREQSERLRERLAVGDIDQLEFQNGQLEAAASELTLLDAQVGAAQAAGELEDALQIPFPALSTVLARAEPNPSTK